MIFIGTRRQVKIRGSDAQRLNALEQLKRARQGGQGAILEQVNWFIFYFKIHNKNQCNFQATIQNESDNDDGDKEGVPTQLTPAKYEKIISTQIKQELLSLRKELRQRVGVNYLEQCKQVQR